MTLDNTGNPVIAGLLTQDGVNCRIAARWNGHAWVAGDCVIQWNGNNPIFSGTECGFYPSAYNHALTPLVTTNPNCTSNKGCYEVALTSPVNGETKRQSLIGFPFFRPTSWADVRFEVNGFAYSPSEAETNNFATKTLWKYNGSTYETYDDVTPGLTGKLSKMEGFWVRLLPGSTGKNVKLLIPLS